MMRTISFEATNLIGEEEVFNEEVSYDDIVLRDGSDQNIELKPGDTIVVPSETMVLVP